MNTANDDNDVCDTAALTRYVRSLDDDSVARWYALLVGNSFVAKRCGSNEDCISSYSNALRRYVDEVWEDIKYYIDRMNKGEKIDEDVMDVTYREFADIVGV